jgi:hypothetical protein
MTMTVTGHSRPIDPIASPMPQWTYRAFGMTLRSEIPMPELTEAPPESRADLHIRYTADLPLPTRAEGVVANFREDGRHFLAWPDVCAFQFRGPDLIEVQPYPDTPVSYLAFPLLGPIMALALHMRGLVTLHASAIDVEGRGVIFVGDKMAGKSTTAAAFLRAGYRLLTDDLLAIDQSDPSRPCILPAYGQIKLSQDAAQAVTIAHSQPLPLVYPAFEKRQHRLTDPFSHVRIVPARLYVLDRGGEQAAVTRLAGPDALRAIMRYSYVTRFGKGVMFPAVEAWHVRSCIALASAVQVATLHIPHDLDRLDEVVALVASDSSDQR